MRLIQRTRPETTLDAVITRAYDLPAATPAAVAGLTRDNPLPAADLAATAVGTPLLVAPLPGVATRPAARPPTELALASKDSLRRAVREAVADPIDDLNAMAAVATQRLIDIDAKRFDTRPTGFNSPNYLVRLRDSYRDLADLQTRATPDLAARITDLDAQLDALVRLIDGDPLPAPSAASPLRIRRFSQTSAAPVDVPELRLTVPAGFKILGGGAIVNYREPGNLLTASHPESITTWYARSKAHTLTSPATITIHVIALYDPDDEYEVRLFQRGQFQPGTLANVEVATAIPVAPGFILTGGGARTNPTAIGHLLTSSYPQTRDLWAVSSKNHIVQEENTVDAYALGLRSRTGRTLRSAIFSVTSGTAVHPTARAYLPPPYAVVGGGALVNYARPGALLTASIPEADGWRASAKDHAAYSPATITAYVIGLADTTTEGIP